MNTQKIVCAAIRHRQSHLVICGVRHFDPEMHKVKNLIFPDSKGSDFEQGFVDNKGEYLDRRAALEVALKGNSFWRNETIWADELFSENLY